MNTYQFKIDFTNNFYNYFNSISADVYFYHVLQYYKAYFLYDSISRGLQIRLLFFSIFYFLFLYFIKYYEKINFEYITLFKFCLSLILIVSIINFLFLSNSISVIVDRIILFFTIFI